MYPHERSLVKNLSGLPFALIGVNSDSDRDEVKQLFADGTVTWRSFWNGGSTRGPISTTWNVRGWPTIYVLDKDGIIRFKNVRGPALDNAIATLLGEMGVEVPKPSEEEKAAEAAKDVGDGL